MNVLRHQLFPWQASNEPYQTTLGEIMARKLSFSTMDFPAYSKTGVSLGKSAAEILGNLRAASPSSAPSRATVSYLLTS